MPGVPVCQGAAAQPRQERSALSGRFIDAPHASELEAKLRRVASDLRVLAAKADAEKASKALDLAARIEALADEIQADG